MADRGPIRRSPSSNESSSAQDRRSEAAEALLLLSRSPRPQVPQSPTTQTAQAGGSPSRIQEGPNVGQVSPPVDTRLQMPQNMTANEVSQIGNGHQELQTRRQLPNRPRPGPQRHHDRAQAHHPARYHPYPPAPYAEPYHLYPVVFIETRLERVVTQEVYAQQRWCLIDNVYYNLEQRIVEYTSVRYEEREYARWGLYRRPADGSATMDQVRQRILDRANAQGGPA